MSKDTSPFIVFFIGYRRWTRHIDEFYFNGARRQARKRYCLAVITDNQVEIRKSYFTNYDSIVRYPISSLILSQFYSE